MKTKKESTFERLMKDPKRKRKFEEEYKRFEENERLIEDVKKEYHIQLIKTLEGMSKIDTCDVGITEERRI